MSAKKPVVAARDVWSRTRLLVEILLEVIEEELQSGREDPSSQWVRLFGTRDSAVVILQKLVKLMAELQEQIPPAQAEEATARISDEELTILRDWLGRTNAANACLEPE